jgi:hypothetical protein
MEAFTEKDWGTVTTKPQSLGVKMDNTNKPTIREGLTVIKMEVTVKESDSQLLIEGPPIPVGEHSNVGDDYRIAVFDSETDALLGWSGGSYGYYNMAGNENIGVMTLKIVTAAGDVKPGKYNLVVKISASGSEGNHYYYNTRIDGYICPDVVFTVKEISTTNSGGALLQMKNFVETDFGTYTGSPRHMGPRIEPKSTEPLFDSGRHITTLRFTPKSAASFVWIESPPIPVEEETNVADDFHIAVFKSNGDILGHSGHSFTHEHWNPQPGLVTLRVWCKSWGTTEDDLEVRIYSSGSNGNYYYFNHRNHANEPKPPLTFTITEVEV